MTEESKIHHARKGMTKDGSGREDETAHQIGRGLTISPTGSWRPHAPESAVAVFVSASQQLQAEQSTSTSTLRSDDCRLRPVVAPSQEPAFASSPPSGERSLSTPLMSGSPARGASDWSR